MSHMDDVIDMSMSTFEAMLSAVTIGGGIVDWGRVITETILRDDSFSGSSFELQIMNLVFMFCKYLCRSCLTPTLELTLARLCTMRNLKLMGQTSLISTNTRGLSSLVMICL